MLGTGVMRNLYTVYDLGNSILSIALTDFEAAGGESNVISIPKGGIAAIAKDAFKIRATPTPLPSPAQTSPPAEQVTGESRNNNSLAVGVGVAVPVVAILALIGAFILFRRRKKARGSKGSVETKNDSSSIGKAELGDDGSTVALTELANDQQPKGELYGNAIQEIGDEQKLAKYELPAAEKRYELA
jgi:LPXTG-motif cell wall-anchored protein